MGDNNQVAVLGSEPVIVSPKKDPKPILFRWDPDLVAEIQAIAERTNRSVNETSELLVRWAVERAKAELEMTGESASVGKRKKP